MTTTPHYKSIYYAIKQKILSGEFAIGDQLPSIAALQEEFGAKSLNTVRSAQQLLVEDGMLRTDQGRGAFVISKESAREVRVDETLATAIEQIQRAQRALGAQRVRRVTIDLDDSQHPHAYYVLTDALSKASWKRRTEVEEGDANDPETTLEMANDADWILGLVEEALSNSTTTDL